VGAAASSQKTKISYRTRIFALYAPRQPDILHPHMLGSPAVAFATQLSPQNSSMNRYVGLQTVRKNPIPFRTDFYIYPDRFCIFRQM